MRPSAGSASPAPPRDERVATFPLALVNAPCATVDGPVARGRAGHHRHGGVTTRGREHLPAEGTRMKTSTNRILTTHVGSLPRPESIRALLRARVSGQDIDAAQLSTCVTEAVAEAV